MDHTDFGTAFWLVDDHAVEGLALLTELRATLIRVERLLIREARSSASTWEEIGAALGVTRQAAHRRHVRGAPLSTERTGSDPVRSVDDR